MPIEALKDWHRTHAGPYLTHTIGLVATDGSQTIQRFGKVASYAAAALVFAQALAEWPGSRILWRMAHGAWRMAHT